MRSVLGAFYLLLKVPPTIEMQRTQLEVREELSDYFLVKYLEDVEWPLV